MSKFRKKPVVIEAIQWKGNNVLDVGDFCPKAQFNYGPDVCDPECFIPTLEGTMIATSGDWIIKGIKGEFYPCKPDIFAATYEPSRMSEPTSRSGEPDQFAATERCLQHINNENRLKFGQDSDMATHAYAEITNARDRERVYRELVEAVAAIEPLDERVQEALAEVSKMGG